MSDDLSLFGDDPQPSDAEPARAAIPDWQVGLLRKALDACGLIEMHERQQAVEAAAGRPLKSLRSLSHDEGLRVLHQLGQTPARATAEKSAWDERDHDTWIDRL